MKNERKNSLKFTSSGGERQQDIKRAPAEDGKPQQSAAGPASDWERQWDGKFGFGGLCSIMFVLFWLTFVSGTIGLGSCTPWWVPASAVVAAIIYGIAYDHGAVPCWPQNWRDGNHGLVFVILLVTPALWLVGVGLLFFERFQMHGCMLLITPGLLVGYLFKRGFKF